MTSLYQLTGQRLALQAKLEALDLDQQTIDDTLESESGELEAKIADYGFVIRNMDAMVEATETEARRIAELAKSRRLRVEAVKAWLLQNMQACGISKIECPAFSLALRNNPASVVVDDETALPAEFMVQPPAPAPRPDKKAIAAVLKAGAVVLGAHLEQSQRLEIK